MEELQISQAARFFDWTFFAYREEDFLQEEPWERRASEGGRDFGGEKNKERGKPATHLGEPCRGLSG